MSKRIALLIAVVGVGLASIGSVYAFNKWRASQPTKENFEPVVREVWERNARLQSMNAFGEPAKPLCISVPWYPKPDARSKSELPLAWYLDFFSSAPSSAARDKQLAQLDALSKVGLLHKSRVIADAGDGIKVATRYSLTEKGWATSRRFERERCFPYGVPHYLGIERFEPTMVSARAGLEVYEVRAKAGMSSEAELAPWAKDPDVQAAFPDIRENLDGKAFSLALVRGGGGWVDIGTMMQDEALRRDPQLADGTVLQTPRMSEAAQRALDEQGALPPPTVDEIKKLLERTHGVGEAEPWPIPCLYLPGSEKLPVDKELFTYRPPHYAVAIFANKTRTSYDRVVNKTGPYLKMLEQLGILTRRTESGMAGNGREAGARFDAVVFELSPAYESRIHRRYPYCFPLGEPSVEFVDVQLGEKDIHQNPNSSFRYKLKVMYRNPPAWMKDPALMEGWGELRDTIEQGMACEGEFAFDRKKRDKHSGGGSCSLAFDSYYENG